MSTINFLPESFERRARARRRKSRHLVMLAVLGMGLTAWGFTERGRNQPIRLLAAGLEAQVQEAREQMTEFVRLSREHDQLRHQQRIKDELSQPIRHTQVITALGRHLGPEVALRTMTIKTVRPAPKAIEKSPAKSKSRSKKSEPARIVQQPDQVDLEFDAVAPDDLTIANLIGDLADDALFDRVTMTFSRTTDVRGVEARLFHLSMRVRLDRRFELEVAHAD